MILMHVFNNMGSAQGNLSGQTSGSTESNIPPGLTEDAKLSDSLWKIYSPDENTDVDVDILFFHGLQLDDIENAFWKTWLARDNKKELWPTWLAKKFPKARILFVSYNCIATRNQFDRNAFGMDLVRDIIEDTKIDIGQNGPVVLVGHCLGGIVIKQFILSAKRKTLLSDCLKEEKDKGKIENFIQNLIGVLDYDVPGIGGSNIGKLASQIKSKSPVLDLLKNLHGQTLWIMDEFEEDCQEIIDAIISFAFAAGKPVIHEGFTGLVVTSNQSRSSEDIVRSFRHLDHFSSCRAKSSGDEVSEPLFKIIHLTITGLLGGDSTGEASEIQGKEVPLNALPRGGQLKAVMQGWEDFRINQKSMDSR